MRSGEFGRKVRQIDVAVAILADHDDIRERLAPRQLVGLVFFRAEEHDRPLRGGNALAQLVAVLQLRGDAQAQEADPFVERARSS